MGEAYCRGYDYAESMGDIVFFLLTGKEIFFDAQLFFRILRADSVPIFCHSNCRIGMKYYWKKGAVYKVLPLLHSH